MTVNERQYNEELNVVEDYRTTKEQFIKDITASNQLDDFKDAIRFYDDLYFIAVDWSIPIALVKYFKKALDK